MSRVVIVGAGQAGGRAALTLRKEGFAGEIVLIGEEGYPPYQRPPLSKAVLLETRTVEQGYLVDPAEYAKRGIDLRLSTTVTGIDPGRQAVSLGADTSLAYDHLVLATGAIPRRIDIHGHDLADIYLLRTARDALSIRKVLEPEKRIAIIGGGFIGLEVAASARQRGCSVTVIEAQDRLLARSLPPLAARVAESLHQDRGVDFLLRAGVKSFEGSGAVSGVRLENDKLLSVDAVIVGIGIVPDTDLAARAGLQVDDGIVTDSVCRASSNSIYAIGDCAAPFLPRYQRRVRLESYQNAEMQGATAAGHIAGNQVCYNPVPWLWSQQYDWVMQTAGFVTEGDRMVTRGSGEAGHLMCFSFEGERLLGVAGIGMGAGVARDVRLTQMVMDKDLNPDPEMLADESTPLKAVLQRVR